MKEENDEKIQESLEKGIPLPNAGIPPDDEKDFKTYQLLFEALAKKPEIELSQNFSMKVTAALQKRKAYSDDVKLYLLVGFIFIFLLAASYIYLTGMNTAYASPLLTTFYKFKWILLFGMGSLCVFQFLDQKLVSSKRVP